MPYQNQRWIPPLFFIFTSNNKIGGGGQGKLLGVDCGHIPAWTPVRHRDGNETTYHAELNSGIAVVIPAWRFLDLLNSEELVKKRDREDAELARRLQDERDGGSRSR